MTAYGRCHLCRSPTGSDIFNGQPNPFTGEFINPGDFKNGVWQCYDCSDAKAPSNDILDPSSGIPLVIPSREPGETRQEHRRRTREYVKNKSMAQGSAQQKDPS